MEQYNLAALYNACNKIQLTLVSATNIAASYNKRYNAAKLYSSTYHFLVLDVNNSGIRHQHNCIL
jgi:hypothetical protein